MARPPRHDYEAIDKRVAEGETPYEVAKSLGIPIGTIYSHKRAKRNKERRVKQYQLEWQEVHMMGDSVGVAWSTNPKHVRTSVPYIIFCNIVLDENGVPRQGEESPVDAGFGAAFAKTLVEELKDAIKYMEKAK